MTTYGKPYKATVENGGEGATMQGQITIRNVYRTSGNPTIEQQVLIDKCEKIAKGDYKGDPFGVYRQSEAMGVELDSEEQRKDGKWYPFLTIDDAMTTMQTGAL